MYIAHKLFSSIKVLDFYKMPKLELYCDGSALLNPGPCGYGITALKEG